MVDAQGDAQGEVGPASGADSLAAEAALGISSEAGVAGAEVVLAAENDDLGSSSGSSSIDGAWVSAAEGEDDSEGGPAGGVEDESAEVKVVLLVQPQSSSCRSTVESGTQTEEDGLWHGPWLTEAY